MQYPAGISFQVSKAKLSRANMPYKLNFFDGIYTIANIRKIQDKIVYNFIFNNTSRVSLSCNSCLDVDRIIAFCRNEQIKEPSYNDGEL